MKKFLDDSVIFYDKKWSLEKNALDADLSRLDVALKAAHDVFGENTFKKWNGSDYEKRINRAVFDVITRFFADTEMNKLILAKKGLIIDKFKEVCMDDAFRDAIERTTKTPKAVKDRYRIWGAELAKIIGKHLDEENMRLV